MRLFLSAACLVALLTAPLHADYRTLEASAGQDKTLAKLEGLAAPGKVFLLDLDSTLLDTRPRQVAILRAWASREGKSELSGLSVEHFQSWDFKETLKRAGVKITEIPALEKEVKKAWRQGFWSSKALVHDLPLAGAAALARRLHAKGATLVYIGRRATQEAGTKAALTRFGFPLDERAILALDVVEKVEGGRKARGKAARAARDQALTKAAALGEVVAAVENEGTKIDDLRTRFPEAMVVHMRTDGPGFTQSRGPSLRGFLRQSDSLPRPGLNPDVPSPKTPLSIVNVPDGDTVKAQTPQGEKVTLRLIGIDTPEKDPLYERASMAGKKARHVKGYGARLVADKSAWKEAKVFLEGMLAKGKLHLQYDAGNAGSGHRDSTSSRRVLAYLWVVTADGSKIDVNAELAKGGYTLDYAYRYPHSRGVEFRGYIKEAKAAGRGYWAPRWQEGEGGAAPDAQPAPGETAPGETAPGETKEPADKTMTTPKEETEAPQGGADVSHVKKGQVYTYSLEAAGMTMTMQYVVDEVTPTSIHYTTVTTVAGNTSRSPSVEWKLPTAPLKPAAPAAAEVKTTHETITVAGQSWETMVTEYKGNKTWIPLKNGLPTFPPLIKHESKASKITLQKVE